MLKILKNLKESILLVIVIVVLLCVQAAADLNLPDFTSKIVNIGIQQGGIQYAVPEAIREDQLNNLMYFTDKDEKIQNSYVQMEKTEKNIEEYPELNNQNLNELKDLNKDEKEELEGIMSRPLMILYQVQDEENAAQIKEKILQGLDSTSPQYAIMAQMSVMDIIKSIPEGEMNTLLAEINTQIDSMSNSILEQAAIQEVKSEYTAIGMDLDKIQNDYIFMTCLQMLGVAFISMASAVTIMFLSSRVAAKLGKTLREKIFKKVLSFSTAEFNQFSTASLITLFF